LPFFLLFLSLGLEEPSLMSMIFPGKLTEMAAFYAERARGGVGLIVTGIHVYIDDNH